MKIRNVLYAVMPAFMAFAPLEAEELGSYKQYLKERAYQPAGHTNSCPSELHARKGFKILDNSQGYYKEGGKVIAPVSVYDFSFGPDGEKFPAVDFRHVADIGEYYGICVQAGKDKFCGRPGDTIPIRLSREEYKDLQNGKRVFATVTGLVEVEKDGRELREAWKYPVYFEHSK